MHLAPLLCLGLFLLAVGAMSTRVVFLGVTERDFAARR